MRDETTIDARFAQEAQERRAAMRLIAQATAQEMRAAIAAIDPPPGHVTLRRPEAGLIMLRGRVGGSGAPFNLGEATVTRCVVALDDGVEGYAMLLGRDLERAELAAVCEALARSPGRRDVFAAALLEPVAARIAARHAAERADAAATRVDFFTLVRGED